MRMLAFMGGRFIAAAVAMWSATACQGPRSPAAPAPSAPAPLAASPPVPGLRADTPLLVVLSLAKETYARDADVVVGVVVTNRSAEPIMLPAQLLESPTLLVHVYDAAGGRLEMMSPPVPQDCGERIAPGGRVTRSLRLDVFSPSLPPGDYIVNARWSMIESNTLRFRIAGVSDAYRATP